MILKDKIELINNMLNCYLNENYLTIKEMKDAELFCDKLINNLTK